MIYTLNYLRFFRRRKTVIYLLREDVRRTYNISQSILPLPYLALSAPWSGPDKPPASLDRWAAPTPNNPVGMCCYSTRLRRRRRPRCRRRPSSGTRLAGLEGTTPTRSSQLSVGVKQRCMFIIRKSKEAR